MSEFPKTTKLTATTKLAARIAMVEPDRLNEAIAAGFYPCAPSTSAGRARQFDLNDIIALRIYGRLIDDGVVPRKAGHIACGLRDFLQVHPDADQCYHLQPSIGSSLWTHEFDTKNIHMPNGPSSPDIISVRVWNFHYLRGRIVHELNEAANVVGDAD